MRLGGFVLVAAVFGATACIRLLPSSVWWRIRGGAPAVPLCDGGVFVDDDDETLKGPPGSEDVIPGVEFKSCMQLMQAEYPYDWNEREFAFEFSTNDAGVVQHLCARRVPSAPQAATCAAEVVEKTRFPAGLSNQRYRVRFILQ